MQKKRVSGTSIDGFISRRGTPRRVGFDGASKQPQAAKRMSAQAPFPRVGQTLAAYSPIQQASSSPTTIAGTPTARTLPLPPITDVPKKQLRRKRFWRSKRFWKRGFLSILIIVLLIGGWLGFKFLYNTGKIFHGNILGILSTTKLRGEDTGRVNILMAGNSSDDVGHDGAALTDSIMIISINTKDHSAFMLSVPRDLWVDIPGFGHAKINEAYVDGQNEKFNQSGYFSGGMGLLQKVIEQNFNINLDYYALVNYGAFRDAVNAVGGIDFNVKSEDPRGLYDPNRDYVTNGPLVKLSNGWHHLNGEEALDLARARGDPSVYGYSYGFPGSDFDRTAHQREELLALRSKVLTTGVLANPLKISNLMDALGKNVSTDFTLSEVHRLYDITKDLNGSAIQSLSLNQANGKDLLASYTSPVGTSALIPAAGLDDFSQIEAFLKQSMSSDPLVREGATVVVLNATTTSGMAAKASKVLTGKGIDVTATDDAQAVQTTTTIIDTSNGKKPATKQLLEKLYGNHIATTNPYANIYSADFIVLLGSDQVPTPTSSP